MKKVIVITLLILFTGAIYAQDPQTPDTIKNWNISGLASINFSQASFSDNWQAGGINSLAGLGLFNADVLYKKDKSAWESILDVKYGLTKQGDTKAKKTDDILLLSSKYGYEAGKNWFYSALIAFKSQMTNGYDNTVSDSVISKFLAPAYITLSIGMDYKPNDHFSLLLAPLTGKMTIVNDTSFSNQGLFGVDSGKKVRYEFGASLKSVLNYEIVKNVTFNSKLGLFYNYLDAPQLDVDWEVQLNMKINEFMSANLIAQILYDKDIIDELQLKEVFGIGFSYKF